MTSGLSSIVNGRESLWPKPSAAVVAVERPRRKRPDGTFACEYCDDCGDVHSIIGDWLGVCSCDIGRELQADIDATRLKREADAAAAQRIGAEG